MRVIEKNVNPSYQKKKKKKILQRQEMTLKFGLG